MKKGLGNKSSFATKRSLEDEAGNRASKPNDPKVPGVTVKSKSLTDKNQFILGKRKKYTFKNK